MAFKSVVCPRSGRPIKVASAKRHIRMLIQAQRELLKGREKAKYVPDDIDTPTRLGHQMRTNKRPPAPYVTMVGQTYLPDRTPSPDLHPINFDDTREIIAQRLIRHEKAAPQRKRRVK